MNRIYILHSYLNIQDILNEIYNNVTIVKTQRSGLCGCDAPLYNTLIETDITNHELRKKLYETRKHNDIIITNK